MGRLRIPPRDIPQNPNPTGWRCITFMIPDDDEWEHIAYSTLYDQLALVWTNWKRTGDDTGSRLCRIWRAALLTWRHCNEPLPANIYSFEEPSVNLRTVCEDGICYLEFECCPGEWTRLANVDQLTNGTQPGPDTANPPPAPNGGTQQTCAVLHARSTLLIPALVNDGDQITLDSANGAGWDGGEFDFGPLWREPNGDQFVGGIDVGFPRTIGTDPVPGANHMSIIAGIGSGPNFVALPIGSPVTVSGGIANGQVFIQVNDDDLSNNDGDYNVCVTVKNNQSGVWTHTFDFTTSSFPAWIAVLPPNGAWNPSGYTTAFSTLSGNGYQAINIQITLPAARTITDVQLFFSYSAGSTFASGDDSYALALNGSYIQTVPIGTAPVSPKSYNTSTPAVTTIVTQLIAGVDNTATDPGGSATFTKLILTGTGTDPFI